MTDSEIASYESEIRLLEKELEKEREKSCQLKIAVDKSVVLLKERDEENEELKILIRHAHWSLLSFPIYRGSHLEKDLKNAIGEK